mgnify:CR=1 FL=1
MATGSELAGLLMMGGIPFCVGGGIGLLINGTRKGFVKGTAILAVIMFAAILLQLIFFPAVR